MPWSESLQYVRGEKKILRSRGQFVKTAEKTSARYYCSYVHTYTNSETENVEEAFFQFS